MRVGDVHLLEPLLPRYPAPIVLFFVSLGVEGVVYSCRELPVNREHLLDMLVDVDSSLGLVIVNLERSLLDELCLDLECLVDVLKDLLDLDLPLGGSMPPELDLWWSALARL